MRWRSSTAPNAGDPEHRSHLLPTLRLSAQKRRNRGRLSRHRPDPVFIAGLILIFIALFFALIFLDVYYFHGLLPKLFGVEGHVTKF